MFANSEDSLNIFNDNAGGRFRVYFPNPYVLDGTWACALLEVMFVPKLTTPTRRIYVCFDFVDNSYVRDSYIPGRAPKYEIRNLLVKTFHLIYYTTTFKKNLDFLHLMTLPFPLGRTPKYDDVIHPVM